MVLDLLSSAVSKMTVMGSARPGAKGMLRPVLARAARSVLNTDLPCPGLPAMMV